MSKMCRPDSERVRRIRSEIVTMRELCERRAWGENELRKRNTLLIASVPGLLTIIDDILSQLAEVTSARDELADIANYLDTYVPKFPAVGGPTQTQRRISELRKVGSL